MRIQGVDSMEETGVVTFPRKGLTIPIHAMSAAFGVDMARRMPAPRAPETYVRDKDNAPIKDKDGKFQKIVDEYDVDYRAKLAEHNTLLVAAAIYHGSTAGDVVAWDTDPDKLALNPREFYRSIFGELVAMKFSDGDLMRWWAAINKLSSIGDEEVKAASASFPE